MNLLITIDANYINPCKVMLHSFFASNPNVKDATIFLLHSNLPAEKLEQLQRFCNSCQANFIPIAVDPALFENAPTSKRYPKEMYYRMLSPLILPQHIDRVLYIDPDTLIINPLQALWEMDLQGKAFAAASHTGLTEITYGINYARLDIDHQYFNTGVMLIDLHEARKIVKAEEIFGCINKYEKLLLLPDQDVFNILYGRQTFALDDEIWNYDARNYSKYVIRSKGKHDLSWVIHNTAILHFCGKHKPWKKYYRKPFGILYKHYMNLAEQKNDLWYKEKILA